LQTEFVYYPVTIIEIVEIR